MENVEGRMKNFNLFLIDLCGLVAMSTILKNKANFGSQGSAGKLEYPGQT